MLRTTHRSTVTEEQIDHLGHMNVRYYAVNAQAATRGFLADLPGWGERSYEVHDVYTRHHREQLVGTPLEVRSAVLDASADGLRLHHELAAADSGVLAATFVHALRPVDDDGRAGPLPDEVAGAAAAGAIDFPDYASTRSISLDANLFDTAPTLEMVTERSLAVRKPRQVTADECDSEGRYRIEMAPMLTWGGDPMPGRLDDMIYETSDGRTMGWASLETRVQIGALPPAGTRVQAFGAGVALHEKVTHHLHWTFDLESGSLLTAFEVISLAFDIGARRAMPLPDRVREREQSFLQADLAPQPTAESH